jgi:hypothetical protein
MAEKQSGADAIVTLVPSQSSLTDGTIPTAVNQDVSLALQDLKTCLFELTSNFGKDIAPSRPRNFVRETIRGVLNPFYIRKMSYEELVAKYVSLWAVLDCPGSERYTLQALLGIKCLINGHLTTSQAIYEEIEFVTSTPAALSYVMRGISSFLRSLAFVVFLFAYFIFVPTLTEGFILNPPVAKHFSYMEALTGTLGNVSLAAVSGMLGSVVSLLLRLSEFENTKGRSQMFLTLTGATLPIVGGVFGAFVAVLLSAKVVNISIGGADGINVWLYIVVGFLSGFSERFSRGFISAAEQQFGGSGDRGSGDRSPKRKVRKAGVVL